MLSVKFRLKETVQDRVSGVLKKKIKSWKEKSYFYKRHKSSIKKARYLGFILIPMPTNFETEDNHGNEW